MKEEGCSSRMTNELVEEGEQWRRINKFVVRSGVDNKDSRKNKNILQGSRLKTKAMGTISFITTIEDSRTTNNG
jgi:hypothetical protein